MLPISSDWAQLGSKHAQSSQLMPGRPKGSQLSKQMLSQQSSAQTVKQSSEHGRAPESEHLTQISSTESHVAFGHWISGQVEQPLSPLSMFPFNESEWFIECGPESMTA